MTALPPGFLENPFAHRALHDSRRPENSLAAIRAAVEKGYGIEIDVQLSSDGEAMVFHDATLDRLTDESGAVRQRDAKALQGIAILGTSERIPTLASVLDEVGGRVPLLIEIKDQDGALGPRIGRLEEAVARALKGYGGPVAVMSFNPHAVMAMRALCPHIPRGLTTHAFRPNVLFNLPEERRAQLAAMEMLEETGAAFISHDIMDLEIPQVARVKAAGYPVLSWTVRSQAEADAALRVADQITFEGFTPA